MYSSRDRVKQRDAIRNGMTEFILNYACKLIPAMGKSWINKQTFLTSVSKYFGNARTSLELKQSLLKKEHEKLARENLDLDGFSIGCADKTTSQEHEPKEDESKEHPPEEHEPEEEEEHEPKDEDEDEDDPLAAGAVGLLNSMLTKKAEEEEEVEVVEEAIDE